VYNNTIVENEEDIGSNNISINISNNNNISNNGDDNNNQATDKVEKNQKKKKKRKEKKAKETLKERIDMCAEGCGDIEDIDKVCGFLRPKTKSLYNTVDLYEKHLFVCSGNREWPSKVETDENILCLNGVCQGVYLV
jgi:hypothetical protein